MAGSVTTALFWGFWGMASSRRWGGTARFSLRADTSLRRSSLISAAGRYSPGWVLALFSTTL